MKKKIIKLFTVLILVISAFVLGFTIGTTNLAGEALANQIIDQLLPIVVSILISAAVMMLKSNSMEAIITSMVDNGMALFTNASSNVVGVQEQSMKTTKLVDDIVKETKSLHKDVKEAIQIKDEVTELKTMLLIMVNNDPNYIKNGVSKAVNEVKKRED